MPSTSKQGRFWMDNDTPAYLAHLSGHAAVTLFAALCRHANSDNRCWPSLTRLSTWCNLHRSTISRLLKTLADLDVIEIERGATPNGGNAYLLTGRTELLKLAANRSPEINRRLFASDQLLTSDQPAIRLRSTGYSPEANRKEDKGRKTKEGRSTAPSFAAQKTPPAQSRLFDSADESPRPASGFKPFPCAKTGETWVLSDEKLSEWQDSFPHLRVETELRKAWQWLSDNPAKRKTPRGMTRFLGSWLARAQDSGRAAGSNGNGYIEDEDFPYKEVTKRRRT